MRSPVLVIRTVTVNGGSSVSSTRCGETLTLIASPALGEREVLRGEAAWGDRVQSSAADTGRRSGGHRVDAGGKLVDHVTAGGHRTRGRCRGDRPLLLAVRRRDGGADQRGPARSLDLSGDPA